MVLCVYEKGSVCSWYHQSGSVYLSVLHVPVQPAQQTLGSCDQLHHGGQELIGGLMGAFVVVGGVLPPLQHRTAQVVVCHPHLPHQGLQVVRLHAVVLSIVEKKHTVQTQKTTYTSF